MCKILVQTLVVWGVIINHQTLCIDSSKNGGSPMSREERLALRDEARDMFYHAYRAYMENAYPADELMPLSCSGRYRGLTPNRGDIDDSLGNFSLTLIDTLDTLVIIGDLEEFEHAVKLIIQDVSFDNDVIVSVFETNIRVLGGLLSGHILAEYLQSHADILHWYKGELLSMAKDVGFRLLPAFNTTTGIPYSRVNLKFGMKSDRLEAAKETCTACAGSIILEMAALSRLTGEPIFEEKAHRAMDELWKIRHRSSDLMGTVLNVHSGDWVRRDSGVGAGIDSYYEYCLKAYILLGDERYLDRFNRHYSAIMKYVWQGPLLLDVHMHRPHTNSRNYMDALLAFWPGLQVLKGDIKPAVETHEMLYQVMQRHKFIPEAFTTDFQIHWGNHPLRPEFLESTYFLYGATNDPYYLQVGKTVLQSLQKYARVPCGYAAVNDVRTGKKEDRMDSFVLAETFKYLYLLFADRDDLILNLDEFIFTTEGHLLPLSLGSGASRNISNILDDDHTDFSSSDDSEFARMCPNTKQLFPESVREPLRNLVDGMCPRRIGKRRLTAAEFSASNLGHLKIIRDMGINIVALTDGRVQLIHTFTAARSTADAEDGLLFMQEMVELSKLQSQQPDTAAQGVSFSVTDNGRGKARTITLQAGPSHFGTNLRGDKKVTAPIVIADPLNACSDEFRGKPLKGAIAIMERGDCMFVEKARRVQRAGAVGAIIIDNTPGSSAKNSPMFSMSGDGSDDIHIPTVFLFTQEARKLLQVLFKDPSLAVTISELAEGVEVWPPSEEESMFQKLKVSVQEFLNKHTGISFSQRISVGSFLAVLEGDRVKLTLEKSSSDADGANVNSYVELTLNPIWSSFRKDIIKGILSKDEWYLPIKSVRSYYKESFGQNYPEELDGALDCLSIAVTCSFNKRGTLLAVGCNDGRIVIWDFLTRGIAKIISAHVHPVCSVSWSRCGRQMASASTDNTVCLWDVVSGECTQKYRFPCPVLRVQFEPRNVQRLLVCPMRHAAVLVNIDGGHQVLPLDEDGDLNIVASFDRRGQYVYTGNAKGKVMVLDVNTLEIKASFRISLGTSNATAVKSIEFARRGDCFLVNTGDRVIRVYDGKEVLACGKDGEPEPIQKLQDLVNKTMWKKCCFSGDGEYVCAGSARQHALYIWEKSIGNLVKILHGTKGELLLDVAWHPVRPIIASISSGVVSVWAQNQVENWSAFAPDFKELDENVEYEERESEFDLADEDKSVASGGDAKEDTDLEVDVCTIDPVAAFCSSDEENENNDCLQFIPTAPEVEDPEENWPSNNVDTSVIPSHNSSSPPAKKKKYKSYDIPIENRTDGELHPMLMNKGKDKPISIGGKKAAGRPRNK